MAQYFAGHLGAGYVIIQGNLLTCMAIKHMHAKKNLYVILCLVFKGFAIYLFITDHKKDLDRISFIILTFSEFFCLYTIDTETPVHVFIFL